MKHFRLLSCILLTKNQFLTCSILFLSLLFVAQHGPIPPPQTLDWIEKAVDREFAPYSKKGISLDCIEKSWNSLQNKPEYRRYKIINSKVYGLPGKIKNLLELLVATYPIPDVDFIYFNEDRIKKSFVKRKPDRYQAPIFVSAKDASLSQFILFSDWLYDPKDLTQGWNAISQSINTHQTDHPWERKVEKLFWRGSPFDGNHFGMYTFQNWKSLPRGQLVYQSRQFPDLIDAAFSQYPDQCVSLDLDRCLVEMGPQSFVSIVDQLSYKYHLLIDGVTCTFPGTHWKLLSGCVPFKQQSSDIMYFYPELIAWKHYIPVRRDLSDLCQKILWARAHDNEAKQIADNARNFALTHLMPEQILLYCRAVLVRYAQLQTFQPSYSSNLENPF